jgi:hypothetical protein
MAKPGVRSYSGSSGTHGQPKLDVRQALYRQPNRQKLAYEIRTKTSHPTKYTLQTRLKAHGLRKATAVGGQALGDGLC